MRTIKISSVMALAAAVALASCDPRRQRDEPIIPTPDIGYVVGMCIDVSGSYQAKMVEDGVAYNFGVAIVDKYFADRAGTDDRLVIAQISRVERALLWEGTAASLKVRFPNARAFRNYLLKHSHPAGSRVHDSVADLVDYVMSRPGVAEGKVRSAVFILSDMDDNFPNPDRSEKRLVDSLASYAKMKGVVGMYWVDHQYVGKWTRHLQNAGFKNYVVESEIVANPTLPSFEQ